MCEMGRRSLEIFLVNARLGNEPVVKKSRNTGSETVQGLLGKLRTCTENQLTGFYNRATLALNGLMLQNFRQLMKKHQQQQAALLALLSKLIDQK